MIKKLMALDMGCSKSKHNDVKEIHLNRTESFRDENDSEFRNQIPIFILDESGRNVDDVGGGNDKLKEIMNKGRQEIKDAQEKLNSSLTIPIVDAEAKVLESGSWLNEKKDLHHRFNVLPPIAGNKKVKDRGMAFEI